MSKRIRIAITLSLLLLIIIHTALVAQQPSRISGLESAPADSAKTAAAIAATNEILEEVSKLRGLKILNPVKSGVKTRSEIEKEVIRNFEESYKPEELSTINKSLIAYGLVSKDFNYRKFMIELLTEQVAGFYRPKSREFFIADWNELGQQKPVMAHELAHALQDQHFNLRRFEHWPRGDGDREAAIHALIEGDATGVMYNYQLLPLRSDITRLSNIADFADQTLLQAERDGQKVFLSAPAVIRESLIFPYVYGAGFVQELVKQRGWEGVSRAFTDLPQSTEQIIHLGKYIAREQPIKIELRDITSLLGPDWKRLETDVNGEFGFFLILSEFIDRKEAKKAARGWGGDQATLFENTKTGQLLIAHLSAWDTPTDAQEFFEAYTRRTFKRYQQASGPTALPANEYHLQTPGVKIFIQLRDTSVLAIEGLPGEDDGHLMKVVNALWKR
jgi:hypothetical protein